MNMQAGGGWTCSSATPALPYGAGTWTAWLSHTKHTSPGEPGMGVLRCSANGDFITRKDEEEIKEPPS